MSSYDIDVDGIRGVLETVRPEVETMSEKGSKATSDGNSIEGQCGTATDVAGAFSTLWQTRSEVGTKAANYAGACADAVGIASVQISNEDDLMAENAGSALATAYDGGMDTTQEAVAA
ncbi:hypothetical protein [Nesterenkonia cremea]|uniref:Excreted virulence factor EspC, type VII ESX diderm n=1 Tax=Nesterenkonia cremea TaxID=1882340 RepID=A0A917EMJ5_9MICC|nr:hypothetical protein [Nesterenkonia cremea]GGE60698.1 hypothetical protein GCM10011401_04510 [Nesterenkonia cremea]